MRVENLEKIAYFMSLNPVTGLNTINNIIGLFKLKIQPSAPGVNLISKQLMVRELNMYFKKLRKEDQFISFETLNNLSEE
jgi:hypothetical protein